MEPKTKTKPNAIIYKYNKYIQVNGTLFYAFEYLLKTLELNPAADIKWYVIIPTTLKIDYLSKLEALFRTKYPLWKTKMLRDKRYFDKAKEVLTKEEYRDLQAKISLLNLAFSKIKVVSGLFLMRKEFGTVLFPCYNSWLNNPIKANKTIVFQNRKIKGLYRNLEFPNIQPNTTFLYETQPQNPAEHFLVNTQSVKQYDLKLAFDYMIPKKLFLSEQTTKIIAGEPIANTAVALYNSNLKPSLFWQVNDRVQFLNTKKIEYHQNFLRFEENTRIIPEAKFYNIPIKVIKAFTKDSKNNPRDINNIPVQLFSYDDLQEDSSVPRLKNNYEHYQLTIRDIVVESLANKMEIQ